MRLVLAAGGFLAGGTFTKLTDAVGHGEPGALPPARA